MTRFLVFLSAMMALSFNVECAHAQRYRYMDSAGNIHFVDSIPAVPQQYREQVIPATPTPVMSMKERLKEEKRREREIKDQQRKAEREKQKEEREQRELQKRIERQKAAAKRASGKQAGTKPQVDTTAEDDIQLIR